MKDLSWKKLATSQLTALRILFLLTVSWDFFLTIVAKAAQRALVLTGVGTSYAPYIVFPWAITIFAFAILILFHLKKDDQGVVTTYGYITYISFIVIYSTLAVVAYLNPLVAWPLIINYIVNIIWALSIMYFRFEVKKVNNANMVELVDTQR